MVYCLILTNFNSIKVRLKLPNLNEGVGLLQFQFHKGTIKTSSPQPFDYAKT